MYYLNGIICGGDRGDSPNDGAYATGRRQFRRMLWLWLTKVVGWSDIDKSGTNWDNPEVAGASDGATDASDPEIFTSATGGFSAIDPTDQNYRYYITITGFSDSTRDGLYLVYYVNSDNQLRIRKAYSGVHTDGFPLSESGLTWRIDELRERSNKMPDIGDWWVVGGTGVGGDFHLRCVSDNSPTHSPDKYDISPYDDWDAVAHAWKAPNRYTSQAGKWNYTWTDSCLVFGVADATHCVLWVRGYQYDLQTSDTQQPNLYYFGDINPFRPVEDTNPVVCIAKQTDANWNVWYNYADGNVHMLSAVDGQSDLGGFIYPTEHGATNSWILDNEKRSESGHSGRFYRLPMIIGSTQVGMEEIRGTLKSIECFHRYAQIADGVPFGDTLDRLAFRYCSFPWNGSKQYRRVF